MLEAGSENAGAFFPSSMSGMRPIVARSGAAAVRAGASARRAAGARARALHGVDNADGQRIARRAQQLRRRAVGQIERFDDALPPITAFTPPDFVKRSTAS